MRLHARFAATAAVVPLLVLTAACGSDDKKDDAKAPGVGNTASATTGASGGSSATSGGSAPSVGGGAPGKTLSAADLTAALLTEAPGWTIEAYDEDDLSASPEKADQPECQPVLDLVAGEESTGPDTVAGLAATKQDTPGRVDVSLGQFAAGKAEKLFKDAAAALPKCGRFSTTEGDSKTDYTIAEVTGATLGDETTRLNFTMVRDERTTTVPVVMVRSGSAVIQAMAINSSGKDDTAAPPTIKDDLLTLQLARLTAAQKG
ncbi:sensor domain-containing protein [Streptomycetaceae bacterium NBC_01309]